MEGVSTARIRGTTEEPDVLIFSTRKGVKFFYSLPLRNLFIFFIKFPFIRIFSRPEEGVFSSFDRYTCFLAPISIGISMYVCRYTSRR